MKAYPNSAPTSPSNLVTFNRALSWNWLRRIGEFLVQQLSQQHELRIEQIIDRKGNVFWEIYDPTSQQTRQFYSETEVRRWLDQRFG